MTTPPEAAPTVPVWLDLEAVVPTGLRERIAATATEAEELAERVARFAERTSAIVDEFEASVAAALANDVHDKVSAITGMMRIGFSLAVIAGATERIMGGCPTDMHYESCSEISALPVIRDHAIPLGTDVNGAEPTEQAV